MGAQDSPTTVDINWCGEKLMTVKRIVRRAVLLVVALVMWLRHACLPRSRLTDPRPEAGGVLVATHGPFSVRSYLGTCLTYGEIVVTPTPSEAARDTSAVAAPAESCVPRFLRIWPGRAAWTSPACTDHRRGDQRAPRGDAPVACRQPLFRCSLAISEGAPVQLQERTGGRSRYSRWMATVSYLLPIAAWSSRPAVLRGAAGTPIVLGRRDLDDSEFWDFLAVDGSQLATDQWICVGEQRTGVRPRSVKDGAFRYRNPSRGRIDLRMLGELEIPSGVTIRGGRRGVAEGPELTAHCPTRAIVRCTDHANYRSRRARQDHKAANHRPLTFEG